MLAIKILAIDNLKDSTQELNLCSIGVLYMIVVHKILITVKDYLIMKNSFSLPMEPSPFFPLSSACHFYQSITNKPCHSQAWDSSVG